MTNSILQQAKQPIRAAYTRPIISQKIRSFDTLAQVDKHISRLHRLNRPYRFNIIQNGNRWILCRIVTGA